MQLKSWSLTSITYEQHHEGHVRSLIMLIRLRISSYTLKSLCRAEIWCQNGDIVDETYFPFK